MKFILKLTVLLTVVFALSAFLIHAQPFSDRALTALMYEGCLTPCFIRIRPGSTGMNEAVQLLGNHDWVANSTTEIPRPIRDAIFYGSLVPRTIFEWRWSESLPDWLNGDERGTIIFEDSGVFDLTISTRLRLGEIFLAFGQPDEASYIATSSIRGQRFQYTAWYADERMVVMSEGRCPLPGYYDAPVRIRFRSVPPRLDSEDSKFSICRPIT